MKEVLRDIRFPAIGLAILLALYLLLPTILVFFASITAGEFLSFPPEGVSARWYVEVATDPAWRRAFGLSLQTSLAGAAIATFAGTAAALGIRRLTHGAQWFRALFIAPIVLPYVVYALGLGQAALSFPIAVITISAGLAGVPLNYTKAAERLGASWMMTVLRVEVPLIRRSMIASLLLTFVYCFDELLVPLFIGGVKLVPFSLQLYRATQESVSPAVAAASVILICVMLVICAIALMVTAKRGGKADER